MHETHLSKLAGLTKVAANLKQLNEATAAKKPKPLPEWRDFWQKPNKLETEMLNNIDIDAIVKYMTMVRKDKPELKNTNFYKMLDMSYQRWYDSKEWVNKKRPDVQDTKRAKAAWVKARREEYLKTLKPEQKEEFLAKEAAGIKNANQAAAMWFGMAYTKR